MLALTRADDLYPFDYRFRDGPARLAYEMAPRSPDAVQFAKLAISYALSRDPYSATLLVALFDLESQTKDSRAQKTAERLRHFGKASADVRRLLTERGFQS